MFAQSFHTCSLKLNAQNSMFTPATDSALKPAAKETKDFRTKLQILRDSLLKKNQKKKFSLKVLNLC